MFSWVLSLVGLGIGSGGETAGKGAELSSVSASLSGTATTSLIVKPSATDRPPARPNPDPQQQPSIRVGMGGGKAAGQEQQQQENKAEEGSLTDQVGNIIDESNKNESQDASREKKKGENSVDDEKPKTVVYRGDGQPLVESDAPRNSKKRMMEEEKPPPDGVKEEL